jgi:transitional endoplasmic reticulum ATPase
MLALREHINVHQAPEEANKHAKELRVHMKHFEAAMKKIRPLSIQELNMCKRIAEEFGKPDLTSKMTQAKMRQLSQEPARNLG